jgi:hypothetical protein
MTDRRKCRKTSSQRVKRDIRTNREHVKAKVVPQFEISEPHLDFQGDSAPVAPETIILRIRGDGRQGGFRFVKDPATGALVVPAHLRDEIANALMAEARGIQHCLYYLQARLYLVSLWLKLSRSCQRVVGHVKGEQL